jgi:FlaA1/EpsC-like NDP-sugar epimerase
MRDRNFIVKRLVIIAWDMLAWMAAVPIAIMLRYDMTFPIGVEPLVVAIALLCCLGQVIAGHILQLYRGRYVVGSFDEVWGVVMTSGSVSLVGTAILSLRPPTQFPRSSLLIAGVLAAAMMLAGRFALRAFRQRSALERDGARTLIYGAGDSGSQIVSLMLAGPSTGFQPVGFLDDDPYKQRRRMRGLGVLGTGGDLERISGKYTVDTVVVAIAGMKAASLLALDRRCAAIGVHLRIIPTASEIVGGAVRLGDISEVTEEDLLGRHPIQTDEDLINEFLNGKRVLVTGAGGSIGSELARQLARYQPSFLGLLDRDESALHAVQLTLDGTGLLTADNLILADIRDNERIATVMDSLRPDIVFHAAALKHLPMLERHPDEAYKTNVIGTSNVLLAAQAAGVGVIVNISTDKAADPVSTLGHSKLITEKLTAGMTPIPGGKCVSVRFGNVLGSRGSVLETFRYQIAKGGPVTVTDERVTRYFMTVREAVHLVLQAAVIGRSGETLILDMGAPVAIVDVARYMIERSGRDVPIVFTGLRTGEKLDEILIGTDESAARPFHPMISHTAVTQLQLEDVPPLVSPEDARALMERLTSKSNRPKTK